MKFNILKKKFKFKTTFVKNENLLSREYQVNFLNNKNKVLDTYSEISIKIEKENKDKKIIKKNKNNKIKKNYKKKIKRK